jgi:hypothetical protein
MHNLIELPSSKKIPSKPSSSDTEGWRRLRRAVCTARSLAIAYAAPVRCGPPDPVSDVAAVLPFGS